MLNTYRKTVRYFLDNELINGNSCFVLMDDSEVEDWNKEWYGIEGIKEAVETQWLPYGYTCRKRFYIRNKYAVGSTKIIVKNNSILKKTITYIPTSISLKELFDMPDGEKVIEYMKQRGMTVCPMKV